jgi:signal transduction histidine kinase
MIIDSLPFFIYTLIFILCLAIIILILLWSRQRNLIISLKSEIEARNKELEIKTKQHGIKLQKIKNSLSQYALIRHKEAKEAETKLSQAILLNNSLEKDVEELRLSCIESQKMISEIRKMNRSVIHDLKSPLNIILHDIEILNPTERNVTEIKKAAHEMLSLIMNVLDVEKSGISGFNLNYEDFDLSAELDCLTSGYKTMLNASSVELSISIPKPCYIHADRLVTARIIENLLSNAVRYTPPFGRIEISAVEINNQIRIEVKDNGTGMHSILQERAFDEFVHDKSKAFVYTNPTGIGLSFCKMAVEAHGGRIGIITKEDEGTRVWFLLGKSSLSSGKPINLKSGYSSPVNFMNENEIKLIKEKLEELKRIEIHEVSSILKILNDNVFLQNPTITDWKTTLETAVFTQNDTLFRKMIDL